MLETVRIYRYLLEFFPSDKPIDTFVKTDAELFRTYLMVQRSKGKGLITKESASKFIRQLKSLFTVAVDADFLIKSPFQSVKAGSTINTDRQEYISGSVIQPAIEAMRKFELKLFLAFTRYGGIRPSELQHLRFVNFNFLRSSPSSAPSCLRRQRLRNAQTGKTVTPSAILWNTSQNRHITPQTIESACEASQAVSYRKAADDRGL